jgi:cytochrome c oxidase subunit 2
MYSSEITHASNFVKGVDTAFLVILGISFLFLIGLTVVMLVFVFKYNNKRNPVATQIEGSVKLEILWTVIPFLITMLMFYYGWAGWKPMTKAPKDSLEVTVYGRMWNFNYQYQNGLRTDTLFLPVNKPVKLNLVAEDVLHSLYIPAFRVKQDMVPGMKNNFMWFQPQKKGMYDIFCAEYCGMQHSYMLSHAKVIDEAEFNKMVSDSAKIAASANISPIEAGKKIMQNIGCFACHSLDGSKLVGPTFKGKFGTLEMVLTGKEKRQITINEEYIKKSIYDPNADIVEGYQKGLMLSYQNQLSDDDIKSIIEFIKTLK